MATVGGRLARSSAAYTRPANTTAYAANSAVADSATTPTVLTFAGLARIAGGSGYITRARLVTDQAANVATFRLWLFSVAPVAINDGAAFTLLYATRANLVGSIDLGPLAQEGAGSTGAIGSDATVRLPFVCASGSRALYGLLETRSAFTPASGQNVDVELIADTN